MKKEYTRTRVKEMLIANPELRDDDYRLIAQYWYNEANRIGVDLNRITAIQMLSMISDGKFTSSETIRRDRQLLQMKNPELRGKMYAKRNGIQQESVKAYLGYGQ